MENKTVLITGAAKRIGATMAEQLHRSGMDVVIHYHSSAKEARGFAGRLNRLRPDSAAAIQADLKDDACYPALIEAALAFKGRLDVLINNASAFYPTPMGALTGDDWDTLINTNLKAPLFLAERAAPALAEHKGCIINITDIHADRPLEAHPVYCVAKAGLVMLTKSLARELAPVRVNAIAPGAITWPQEMDEAARRAILDRVPLKQTGKAEDIARTAAFLISDAGYITGQIIAVDGGRTLYS